MSFLAMMLIMSVQDDGLSAYMPKTIGKKKDSQKKIEPEQPEVEDEEYEVEEPINDPMMAMMPMSFGKQNKKRDLTTTFAKTKRVVSSLKNLSDVKQETKPNITVNSVEDEDEDDDDDDDSDDDMIGPMPAEAENLLEEEEEDEDDEFPVSHEIILKDHTKVNPS